MLPFFTMRPAFEQVAVWWWPPEGGNFKFYKENTPGFFVTVSMQQPGGCGTYICVLTVSELLCNDGLSIMGVFRATQVYFESSYVIGVDDDLGVADA